MASALAEVYGRQWCTYCQEEVAGLRVRCADCPDMDVCLPCFSAGAEIGSHRNDHSYYIMDSGAVGIFQGRGSWSAKEEVRLLDAIEQFGFGNWEDISKHIETKTPEEAKDEYISRFLEGSIGRATWGGVEPPIKPAICPARDEGPLGPEAVGRLPPLAITSEEAAQLGYMPKRDDFEREHDHEAEQIISSLSLNPEDDDLDIALKLSQVDIYTRRLRERTRRKRLVRDYQLVSVFYNNIKNRGKPITKMAKEKKDFLDKLRPLTRFSSQAEHTAVATSLWRERELRLRLTELVRYRRNGITSSEECPHFERHAAANNGTTNSHPQWMHNSADTQSTRSQSNASAKSKKKRKRRRLKFHKPKVHTGRKYRMWMLQKAIMLQQQQHQQLMQRQCSPAHF